MSFFSWAAPLFKLAGRRWSEDDFRAVASILRPYASGERPILDLGGGTGQLGAGVAAVLGTQAVIADATPQMLVRVAANPHVSVTLASAQALPFPDGHFDALICSDAFHHFRNQDEAVREMARVVRPGGGVLILDLEPKGLIRAAALVERALREPATFMSIPQIIAFMAERGIIGTATSHRVHSYSFLGTVVAS
jgi:ubiquinone/menaquinone biosynthesis C-methylase UbiE